MSIGHRLADEELSESSIAELYSALGERDTPQLYERSYRVDNNFDVPSGAGNSIDRKTVYIDRTLYQEVMDNEFEKTELTPQQIIDNWIDHEHTEKCLVDGDNAVDNYLPGHRRSLRREHERVLVVLGKSNAKEKVRNYEAVIWPALLRCYHREIKRPPKDLWCAPWLDQPTERDQEILEEFRKLGVTDANKRAKYDVHYGYGPMNCVDCRMWKPDLVSQEHGQIAACSAVTGLVRDNRHCDLWMPK